jgi:hypothetical protein
MLRCIVLDDNPAGPIQNRENQRRSGYQINGTDQALSARGHQQDTKGANARQRSCRTTGRTRQLSSWKEGIWRSTQSRANPSPPITAKHGNLQRIDLFIQPRECQIAAFHSCNQGLGSNSDESEQGFVNGCNQFPIHWWRAVFFLQVTTLLQHRAYVLHGPCCVITFVTVKVIGSSLLK